MSVAHTDRVLRPASWRHALVSGLPLVPALLLLACEPETAPAQASRPSTAPVSLFSYNRSAPLHYQESAIASPNPDVQLFQVSYDSPAGGRVTGILATPVAAGPHAGVVLMHGLPGTAQGAMTNQGLDYASRGAVAIAIDAPWVRRGGLPTLTTRDSAEQVQLIQDLQRAVDLLLERSDVDASRIAYQGGSYGGAMGSLFVGIEHRLKTAILFVPDGGLVAHFTGPGGDPLGPLAGLPAAAREQWLAAMRPIEPIQFIARATIPLLLQNGRQDQLVSVEDAEALHAAAPPGRTVQWYDAGHGLTPEARAERLAWMVREIGLVP